LASLPIVLKPDCDLPPGESTMRGKSLSVISSQTGRRLILAILLLVASTVFLTDIPLEAEVAAIRLYKKHVSPVSSSFITCRFRPT